MVPTAFATSSSQAISMCASPTPSSSPTGSTKFFRGERRAVGAKEFGRNAQRMLNIDDPAQDWIRMAKRMGVDAAPAITFKEFVNLLNGAMARRGPLLTKAVI